MASTKVKYTKTSTKSTAKKYYAKKSSGSGNSGGRCPTCGKPR